MIHAAPVLNFRVPRKIGGLMAIWTPDPTFYPSPRMAMEAPSEKLAFLAVLHAVGREPDAIGVVDLDPKSSTFWTMIHNTSMPNAGDELHQFGWNACSSSLCPYAPHPIVVRLYLLVHGIRA